MNINVICTTAAEHIGNKLIAEYGIPVIFPEKNREKNRYFPGGEVYVRIPEADNLRGTTVVLHSGAPNPNDGLMELEQVLAILKARKIKPIVFFLCFPYQKQDRVFVPGELNAAQELLNKLTRYYRVKKIYTIDLHFSERGWLKRKNWFGRRIYPVVNLSALDLLKQAALRDYPDMHFLVPDKGGQKRTGLKGTLKKRRDSFTTEMQSDEDFRKFVEGKRIAAVDDLLQTGGTMVNFYQECLRYGATEVIALITAGIVPEGIARIAKAYSKLYMTNVVVHEGLPKLLQDLKIDISRLVYIDVIGLVVDALSLPPIKKG